MKLNEVTKTLLTLAFFFTVSGVFAQLPEEPDNGVDPVDAPLNPAPISDYLIPMLVLGVATAFILLKKKAPAKV